MYRTSRLIYGLSGSRKYRAVLVGWKCQTLIRQNWLCLFRCSIHPLKLRGGTAQGPLFSLNRHVTLFRLLMEENNITARARQFETQVALL